MVVLSALPYSNNQESYSGYSYTADSQPGYLINVKTFMRFGVIKNFAGYP